MEERTILEIILRPVAVVACCIALSVSSCVAHIDYRVSEDIKTGADPIRAACAHGVQMAQGVCNTVAAK